MTKRSFHTSKKLVYSENNSDCSFFPRTQLWHGAEDCQELQGKLKELQVTSCRGQLSQYLRVKLLVQFNTGWLQELTGLLRILLPAFCDSMAQICLEKSRDRWYKRYRQRLVLGVTLNTAFNSSSHLLNYWLQQSRQYVCRLQLLLWLLLKVEREDMTQSGE